MAPELTDMDNVPRGDRLWQKPAYRHDVYIGNMWGLLTWCSQCSLPSGLLDCFPHLFKYSLSSLMYNLEHARRHTFTIYITHTLHTYTHLRTALKHIPPHILVLSTGLYFLAIWCVFLRCTCFCPFFEGPCPCLIWWHDIPIQKAFSGRSQVFPSLADQECCLPEFLVFAFSGWAKPAGLWDVPWAPRRPPPDGASDFPAELPRFSSPPSGPSWDPIFIGPSTFLATLVSWVTKLGLSPGETGRDLLEQGEAAVEEGDIGFSSTTSRWLLSSLAPR